MNELYAPYALSIACAMVAVMVVTREIDEWTGSRLSQILSTFSAFSAIAFAALGLLLALIGVLNP